MTRLLIATSGLAVLIAGHIFDHAVRQPGDEQLSLAASSPGLLGAVAIFVALVFVVRRHPRAPEIAGVIGLATAVGFVAVHLAPHWSVFSDPYEDRYLDTGSWIEMLGTLTMGLIVASEGLRLVRARSRGIAAAPTAAH